MKKAMDNVVRMYVGMYVAMILVVLMSDTTKVRLYYHRRASKLSTKSVTPTGWVTTRRNATHYVDIPVGMLVGRWECTGHDYSTHNRITTYDIYVLRGAANRYAKRSCREVV